MGEHDFPSGYEEVEDPRDVSSLHGPQLEYPVVEMPGERHPQGGTVLLQQLEPSEDLRPHLRGQAVDELLDGAPAPGVLVVVDLVHQGFLWNLSYMIITSNHA